MAEDLSPDAISKNLRTRVIGRKIRYYDRVTSTMEMAQREAETGAAEGTVVVVGEQTAGQGRLQRTWLSPKGNVALSVILRPPVEFLPYLIMVSSLAVVSAIEATTDLKPVIKWPNDVLIGQKKICGILIENRVKGNTVDCANIGIGINVNMRMSDFPEISPFATSLSHECGREVPRQGVIVALLGAMDRLYLSLPGNVYEQWRDRLVTLGKRITVTWGNTRYEGIAESVASDGSLSLRHDDGSVTRIVAGDASLR